MAIKGMIRVDKKQKKSEATKQNILQAAKQLFAQKGFHAVTMREIAKKSGCSHTAIYVYFKDKEALLEQISIPPLERLYDQLVQLQGREMDSLKLLQTTCKYFVEFGIQNRTMYTLYATSQAGRVDVTEPGLELNQLRNQIFHQLSVAIQRVLEIEDDKRLLDVSRIFFYQMHGVIMTYIESEESEMDILERVLPIVEQSVEMLVRGTFDVIRK